MSITTTFPGKSWDVIPPQEAGMNREKLDQFAAYIKGYGCIAKDGRIVFEWGRPYGKSQGGTWKTRWDVWSAAKTVMTFFLLRALQDGKISTLDQLASDYEPRLKEINKSLGNKDAQITLRHCGNQISCYGVKEPPGTAFCYNDWQMRMFIDILFLKIYGSPYENWDRDILHPLLTDILQCEDAPTLNSYGPNYQQGRIAMSPRDFARFGQLYLNHGNWNGVQVLDEKYVEMAVTSPIPNTIPRAGMEPAELIPGQRSYGSTHLPDNQTEHFGSYSWCWWINGTDSSGRRYFHEAPKGTFCALGDHNGKRGLSVIPEHQMVISWNDTVLDTYEDYPHPLNPAFKLIEESLQG